MPSKHVTFSDNVHWRRYTTDKSYDNMIDSIRHKFGEPGHGIHRFRIFGIAAVDLGMTLLFALMLTWWFSTTQPANSLATNHLNGITFIGFSVGLIILGILAHRLFRVNTTINTLIFGHV